jgi:hypothetical protein
MPRGREAAQREVAAIVGSVWATLLTVCTMLATGFGKASTRNGGIATLRTRKLDPAVSEVAGIAGLYYLQARGSALVTTRGPAGRTAF